MTLGASELRAHASGHGEELATLGLQARGRVRVGAAGARRGRAAARGGAAAATGAAAR